MHKIFPCCEDPPSLIGQNPFQYLVWRRQFLISRCLSRAHHLPLTSAREGGIHNLRTTKFLLPTRLTDVVPDTRVASPR